MYNKITLGKVIKDCKKLKEVLLSPVSLDLVKVGNDLIEKPQTFQAFLVDVALCVKLFEIRYRGEHHTHTVVGLVVEVLLNKKKNPRSTISDFTKQESRVISQTRKVTNHN